MSFWLDNFTGTTWKEFCEAGATVTGFSERMRGTQNRIAPGDIFLCYLTGVMRWIGALEVIGKSNDQRRIWKDKEYPVRFDVKPLIVLEPETGVLMDQLEGRVAFFEGPEDRRTAFKAFVRGSPRPFKRDKDGDLLLTLLREAKRNPVPRQVDPKQLGRKPQNRLFRVENRKGKTTVPTMVSVPESDEVESPEEVTDEIPTRHTEIQFNLLTLGAEMGFDLWVARNDRSRKWKNHILGEVPGLVRDLPTQFNDATNRTIELIDVLWLKGNSIVAAFEVESTTAVYSGLLRMSDLLALQPNLQIDLFLVAPEERAAKVEQEILRPTFSLRENSLAKVCGFIGFNTLMKKLDVIREENLARSLRPDFLKGTAKYFKPD
jgi:hypothetical protein